MFTQSSKLHAMLCLYSALVLLQGLKDVISYHAEIRERRGAASDGALPLA